MSEANDGYIFTVKGGENCPFYRTEQEQLELLKELTFEAMNKAVDEYGFSVHQLVIETKYHNSLREPQCCYGEVKVYDSSAVIASEWG